MKVSYVLLLFVLIYCVASGDDEADIQNNRKRILDQLTRTRTVLKEGYHLVTRQIATAYMFRNYRTVGVIFYPITRDVTDARFTFQAEELHLNSIGSCSPQNVMVHIKRASYPAVNPDGYDFPKNFIDPSYRERIHTLELESDGHNRTYSIKNPTPGNWYAILYIKWEDPRTQKVSQEGLVANCDTILYTDLQIKREEDIEFIDCYTGVTVDAADLPALFKCIAIDSTDRISFNITIINTKASTSEILFTVQSKSLPTEDENLVTCAFDPRLNNIQTVTFSPSPGSWHFIQIEHVEGNASRFADCESYYLRNDDEDNITVLDLMRDDKGRFFTFDYGLPTSDVQDATSLVNLTADETKSLRFQVNQIIDIGGTLAIEASLLMSLKYYMGYRREIKKGAVLAFTDENQYFRAVICMDIGHASVPLETGHCKYNDQIRPALFVLNSTDSESIYDKTIIPFPDSGTWYLTLRLFCDEVVCPCRTSHNGTRYYVEADSEGFDLSISDGEDIPDEVSNQTREGESVCNTTVVLSISSSSCVAGRCSNHGNCLLNTYGGLVMSFCSCSSGYGGWDCSDDSRMDSRGYMLISILLLTLSNLLFFFSVYIAIIRLYYTEAMMYTFTMVFSSFYHACDAPAQVAYCIARGNILQFGDFYCGLMSFWVTLLAMSIIGDKLRSSFQLTGAIVIALLTTWNMHSFVSFLLPVAVGLLILFLSWYVDYRKIRRVRYPRSYYMRHLPFGLLLVVVGLVCYGFLQTEQNYKIVHSVWHMIIALSVAFLLPDVKRDGKYNAFLPSPQYCKLQFCRVFSRPRTPIPNNVTVRDSQP